MPLTRAERVTLTAALETLAVRMTPAPQTDRRLCTGCYGNYSDPSFCIECGYCNSGCCRCNAVRHFTNRLEFHTDAKVNRRVNKSERFISAEIEVAGIKKKAVEVEKIVRKWKGNIVRDGSLPHTGFEINTSPANGDEYIKQVTQICKTLDNAVGSVTDACGLHVHLDARDFNFHDISRLIKVYAAIEPALFNMVPASRRASRFALRCADHYEQALSRDALKEHKAIKEKVVVGTYGEANSTTRRKRKYDTARYNALNLHSWFYRGTIEYRLFNGTIDASDIINWGMIWANILDFSLESSEDDITRLMNKNKSYESLLKINSHSRRLREFIKNRYEAYAAKKSDKIITKGRAAGFTNLTTVVYGI